MTTETFEAELEAARAIEKAAERGPARIVVSEFVSVDGVMEAPGGEPGYAHSGWVFDYMGEESLQYKLQETLEAEALLIGRVTYESFAGAWPEREGQFADKMNAMPKYVVSSTLTKPGWNNTQLIAGNPVAEIALLRQRATGTVLVPGSRMLVHTLLEHDLVDELRLMVFPIALGSGRRLFPDTARKLPLALADSRAFASGVVVLSYTRKPSPQ
jgi:dihydrofolate reductase